MGVDIYNPWPNVEYNVYHLFVLSLGEKRAILKLFTVGLSIMEMALE